MLEISNYKVFNFENAIRGARNLLLHNSFNQLRTCTMSYENLVNIYFSRCNH
jgi:hypothetical protein